MIYKTIPFKSRFAKYQIPKIMTVFDQNDLPD